MMNLVVAKFLFTALCCIYALLPNIYTFLERAYLKKVRYQPRLQLCIRQPHSSRKVQRCPNQGNISHHEYQRASKDDRSQAYQPSHNSHCVNSWWYNNRGG